MTDDSFFDACYQFNLESISQLPEFVTWYRSKLPIKLTKELYVSLVFVDLARDPIGLVTKFRSENFEGYENDYFNSLNHNFQFISEKALIRKLVSEPNLIVVDDSMDLEEEQIGDRFERQFILQTGWESSIFHSLFQGPVVFGYLCVFTIGRHLMKFEIDQVVDFFSETIPLFTDLVFPLAYQWLSNIHSTEIKEIEGNLFDFVIAITGSGMIVRINDQCSYYLGKRPDELLGNMLPDINSKLHEAIRDSSNREKNQPLVVCEIENSIGQKSILELTSYRTKTSTDATIVTFARDITTMSMIS